MRLLKLLLIAIIFQLGAKDKPIVVYLQPNTTQLFTELYQAYGMLKPPERTFFESALYLDQAMPPEIVPLQYSNQAIFEHADKVLTEFHKRIGDLELYVDPHKPKPFFYTAVGSKQLIVALVYGIVMSQPDKKFLFAEEAPLYAGHPNAVSGIYKYPNARFVSFHHPSEVKPEKDEVLIEIVTSPNNPDGKFRKPMTDAKIIIADLVFASSAFGDGTGYTKQNIEWIKKARSEGKLIFSFNSASKQFGKTGDRCGYMWYPLYDSYAASIFKKFFGYISASTVASGTTGLSDFLDLIKAFLDLPDTGIELRNDAYKSLVMRHQLVEKELVRRYPGSIVTSIPGSPTLFAKIKDQRIPKQTAAEVLLEDLSVQVNNGEPMGETNEFVRLNLSGYSQLLAEFLNRLAKEKKYKVKDLFFASKNVCPRITIFANHHANPGDCFIDADASKGPIEILLPPFIDYDDQVITIKKIDSSEHPVIVKSENVTRSLKKQNETLELEWSQPFYMHGQWKAK